MQIVPAVVGRDGSGMQIVPAIVEDGSGRRKKRIKITASEQKTRCKGDALVARLAGGGEGVRTDGAKHCGTSRAKSSGYARGDKEQAGQCDCPVSDPIGREQTL